VVRSGPQDLLTDAEEVVRGIYDQPVDTAGEWVDEIARDFTDRSMPHEVRRLGRTIGKWRNETVAWHTARVTNGPTEAVNNLVKRVKRVKRVAFGFRRFAHYRIRALLYAGAINWSHLNTLTPR
jgi:transposase